MVGRQHTSVDFSQIYPSSLVIPSAQCFPHFIPFAVSHLNVGEDDDQRIGLAAFGGGRPCTKTGDDERLGTGVFGDECLDAGVFDDESNEERFDIDVGIGERLGTEFGDGKGAERLSIGLVLTSGEAAWSNASGLEVFSTGAA